MWQASNENEPELPIGDRLRAIENALIALLKVARSQSAMMDSHYAHLREAQEDLERLR